MHLVRTGADKFIANLMFFGALVFLFPRMLPHPAREFNGAACTLIFGLAAFCRIGVTVVNSAGPLISAARIASALFSLLALGAPLAMLSLIHVYGVVRVASYALASFLPA